MEDELWMEEIRARRQQREQTAEDYGWEDGEAGRSAGKGDYLVRITLLQTLLCALLVGGVFLLSKLSPDRFHALGNAYRSIMSVDMPARDMFAKIKNSAMYVLAPMDNWKKESKTPQENSGDSPAEEAADTTAPTSSAAAPTTAFEEDLDLPSGGVDIAVLADNVNASFAPVYVTAQPMLCVDGRISSRFGYRIHPITGEEGLHTGLDIAAPEGTPIAAAWGGVVEEATSSSGFGNYVKLRHENGMLSVYAHCRELYVTKGAHIRAGEIIALVGQTGAATGPHLHFEIRINDVRMNPEWIWDTR